MPLGVTWCLGVLVANFSIKKIECRMLKIFRSQTLFRVAYTVMVLQRGSPRRGVWTFLKFSKIFRSQTLFRVASTVMVLQRGSPRRGQWALKYHEIFIIIIHSK